MTLSLGLSTSLSLSVGGAVVSRGESWSLLEFPEPLATASELDSVSGSCCDDVAEKEKRI